ncbi:MAG: hypothetical protein JWN38_303 [Candidatus Saccharibacteria bacterium]|nr:hypothetical protein [Candidatus Saccharibacteria bacterium]
MGLSSMNNNYILSELPSSPAEDALWMMGVTQADEILTERDPIDNLKEFSDKFGVEYYPRRSMEVEGHRVAWMGISQRMQRPRVVNNSPDALGVRLMCECDFQYRFVPLQDGRTEAIKMRNPNCVPKKAALIARQIVHSEIYGFDARTRFQPDFKFMAHYGQPAVDTAITAILHRFREDPTTWLGNTEAGYLGAVTIFNILGFPRGDASSEPRYQKWHVLHDLADQGRLEILPNWGLRLPVQSTAAKSVLVSQPQTPPL